MVDLAFNKASEINNLIGPDAYPIIHESDYQDITIWIWKMGLDNNQPTTTIARTLRIFNNYLVRIKTRYKELPLIAAACLSIASKQGDSEPIDTRKLARNLGSSFTYPTFREVRNKIVVSLEGKIFPLTAVDVFTGNYYDNFNEIDPKIFATAEDIAMVCMCCNPKYFSFSAGYFADLCIRQSKALLQEGVFTDLENRLYNDLVTFSHDFDYRMMTEFQNLLPLLKRKSRNYRSLVPLSEPVLLPVEARKETEVEEVYKLGKGAYGEVWMARYGESFSARKTQAFNDSGIIELSILATYKHPNVVEMLSFSLSTRQIFINLELGTALAGLVHPIPFTQEQWENCYLYDESDARPGIIPVGMRRDFQSDILDGFRYLHTHGIMHRDIKVDNLIVVGGRVKIVDFGLAIQGILSYEDKGLKSTFVYTVENRPPEILINQDPYYAFHSEIWAIATVLLEIETGIPPFPYNLDYDEIMIEDNMSDHEASVIFAIAVVLGTEEMESNSLPYSYIGKGLKSVQDVGFRNMILRMLNYDPNQRPLLTDLYYKTVLFGSSEPKL